MRIYCVQLNIAWEDKRANFKHARQLLIDARVEPGSLVVLPEMFATGFSLNTEKTAETAGGPTYAFLADLAREMKAVIVGAVVRAGSDGRKATNQSPVFAPSGELIADYAKLHPFSYGKESQRFIGGNALQFFAWNQFTVAPTICYDLRFPELYRRAAQKGAHLFTVIANWPLPREHHWITLLQARAIENQCFVAGCNRSGADPHLSYGGRSLVIDPQGKILADAGAAECVISADIQFNTLQNWRRDFPALSDIRQDLLPPAAP